MNSDNSSKSSSPLAAYLSAYDKAQDAFRAAQAEYDAAVAEYDSKDLAMALWLRDNEPRPAG